MASSTVQSAEDAHVLVAHHKTLMSEQAETMQFLTQYGKWRVDNCKEGRAITPELKRRMNMLVNQEYRVVTTCKKLEDICLEIFEACEVGPNISQETLTPFMEELKEFLTDLTEHSQQRKDNIDAILKTEVEGLQRFKDLHTDIGKEKKVSVGLAVGTAAGAGILASCPVTFVVVLGVGLLSAAGHNEAATRVQNALVEDMRSINGPIQYMESFKCNMDDSLDNLKGTSEKIHFGRSAAVKRRMEIFSEEMVAIRQASCKNFMSLAGDRVLVDGFGFTEQKRTQVVQQYMIKDGIDISSFQQAMG